MRILWIGWPRSGTTWGAACLRRCLNCKHCIRPPQPDNTVMKAHWEAREAEEYTQENHKTVLNVRDPRDVIVSHYYLLCKSNPAYSTHTITIEEYTKDLFTGKAQRVGTWPEATLGIPRCGWKAFYEEWLERGVDCVVRQEDLIIDRSAGMKKVIKALGLQPANGLEGICKNYENPVRPMYDIGYGSGNISTTFTTGGSSIWRKHLSEIVLEMIYDYCGELMEHFGYELERTGDGLA